MGAPRKATFGEIFFMGIDEDPYLQELYANILYNYTLQLFNVPDNSPREINIDDALRFADLLSKSVSHEKSDMHKMWAQEIVALLHVLYPSDNKVTYYMGSVLSHSANYRGLKMKVSSYRSAILFEELYSHFEKDYLRIPNHDDEYFFYAQKKIFDNLNRTYFSYSGPTSMGKSLIMRVFIKAQVLSGASDNYAILVPTKALINEVKSNIIQDFKTQLRAHNYCVISSARDLLLEQDHNFIFVVTPERFLHLITSRPEIDIDYLFIDEAHKISSKSGRSAFYYKVVDKMGERKNKPHVIFASPNIPNPEIYLKLIPAPKQEEMMKLIAKYAPVSQIKYLIDFVEHKLYLYNDHMVDSAKALEYVSNFSQHATLSDFVRCVGDDKQNLIYCSSKDGAVTSALEYAKKLDPIDNADLQSLSRDIKAQVHSAYYLADLVLKGVAYHVGYLPASIRLRIEKCFRAGYIRTIFCTSTLVEGVNLPADNLFISSYKNGTHNMTQVEFRNLIGRIGRIEYNLYGNVFLVRMDEKLDKRKFIDLLKEEIPEQKLSINIGISENQKRTVVECLRNGDIQLGTSFKTETREGYSLMRKFSLMLVRDITTGSDSLVRREFEHLMQPGDFQKIRAAFNDKPINDNIDMSFEQFESLDDAIANGLEFPTIDAEKGIDYQSLFSFLEELARYFKWDVYERHTLGKRNRDGEHAKLRWYAVVLSQWISGYGLSRIIHKSLEYKKNNPYTGVWSGDRMISPYYEDDLPEHKNYVIADVLGVIENVILFSISNYFRDVSLAYKRFHNIPESEDFPNDWYDFVEYGTTNPMMRILQRAGYSRESAAYIKDHPILYSMISDTEVRLKREALRKCSDEGVVKETEDVYYNFPELFGQAL